MIVLVPKKNVELKSTNAKPHHNKIFPVDQDTQPFSQKTNEAGFSGMINMNKTVHEEGYDLNQVYAYLDEK